MYIRKSTRKYKGKTYTNYLLVESVQTPEGPRQRYHLLTGQPRARAPRRVARPGSQVGSFAAKGNYR